MINAPHKQYVYCAICDGKGPVTYYKCKGCGRLNDLHKPKGEVSTATLPRHTLE